MKRPGETPAPVCPRLRLEVRCGALEVNLGEVTLTVTSVALSRSGVMVNMPPSLLALAMDTEFGERVVCRAVSWAATGNGTSWERVAAMVVGPVCVRLILVRSWLASWGVTEEERLAGASAGPGRGGGGRSVVRYSHADDIVQLTGIEPVMRETTHLSRLV